MKSLHILVLEDNIEDINCLVDSLSPVYNITPTSNLKMAKEALTSIVFDLAIIDIYIDGKLDGIALAQYIQKAEMPIPFLFLTNMQNKTVFLKAKLTMPFTYLLKPFNVLELQYSIELALEKGLQQERTLMENKSLTSPNYILVKTQHTLRKLNFSEIEYVEVEENYSTLYTEGQKHVVKKSLSKIKALLANENFEQIHRKFLINFDKVKEINLNENTVYLNSGFQIPISERYKRQLVKQLGIIS